MKNCVVIEEREYCSIYEKLRSKHHTECVLFFCGEKICCHNLTTPLFQLTFWVFTSSSETSDTEVTMFVH